MADIIPALAIAPTFEQSEPNYSTDLYNTIPTFRSSWITFLYRQGSDHVEDTFSELIKSHNLESTFGIGLLHRHFKLHGNEKLVEHDGVATAWGDVSEEAVAGISKLVPTAWMVFGMDLVPFEFGFVQTDKVTAADIDFRKVEPMRKFKDEFIDAAKSAQLDGTICLRLYTGNDCWDAVKVKQGRAHITLESGQAPAMVNENALPTWWFFKPGDDCGYMVPA